MTLRHTLSKKYSQISAMVLPLFRKYRRDPAMALPFFRKHRRDPAMVLPFFRKLWRKLFGKENYSYNFANINHVKKKTP